MPATSILQKKTNDPSKEGNKVFSKLLPQYHLGFAMVQEEFFTKLVFKLLVCNKLPELWGFLAKVYF